MFELHERLKADTWEVGEFPLCLLLLTKDANYPWTILVPKRAGITEIYQLVSIDRQKLVHESCLLAEAMQSLFSPDKLNIATIGNIVPQLHMHHVARTSDDIAWPSPVWGAAPALSYSAVDSDSRLANLRAYLAKDLLTLKAG